MFNDLMTLWSDSSVVTHIIWLSVIIFVLYLGRLQAHQVIYSSFRALSATMRLWASTLTKLEQRVADRNKQVLLASGEANIKKSIEREFMRVNVIVQRDLGQYPALHRQIKDVIDKVEEDYQNSAETAPLPPAWSDVVMAISNLPVNGDPAVNKVLKNINKSIDEAHRQTLNAYQKSSAERQRTLSVMRPQWRQLDEHIIDVKGKIDALDERTRVIDEQMQRYQDIRSAEDKVISSLTSSSLTQFFIAGLVLCIAVLGGLINFQLIALPMSEMVGGTNYIGSVKTSDIAALVIILIEIVMGLFLLETLRITHLFPIIGSMDDKMRRRMMLVSFTILFTLASIEASLAYMRDLLAIDHEALQQSLAGTAMTPGAMNMQFRWIPTIGQMVMGFMLPFALAFIAIPLESFVHALRTLLGLVVVGVLRVMRVLVRVTAAFSNHMGKVCINIYDLVVIVPISIEKVFNNTINEVKGKPVKIEKVKVAI